MRTICIAGDEGLCVQCGQPVLDGVRWICKAGPHGKYARTNRKIIREPGLGDAIAKALAKMGITESRVREVKRLFGLPPTCGCQRRKAWLNRVSEWWRGESTTANQAGTPPIAAEKSPPPAAGR